MKRKKAVALLLAGTLISSTAAMAADAGAASNPLIALNWLKNTFIPNTVSAAEKQIDSRLSGYSPSQPSVSGAASTELRVKRGDVLHLDSGATLTSLAGGLSSASSGVVVDLSAGAELPYGGNAAVDHRYLTAENARGSFSVTSDTAVVRLTGSYQLAPSSETDYNAMADALRSMRLFQGSDVPYGSGYELENPPTRIQGLIMFIRLLGEDAAARAYSGSQVVFTDVPEWAYPYAAYAFDKGYTVGQDIDAQQRVTFGTANLLTPRDYMTFLLRALGYTEGSHFQWLSAVEDARSLGLLTPGEVSLLSEKTFLRAQVVYLSFFALSAQTAGGGSLIDRLTASGAVDSSTATAVMRNLQAQRL